MTIHAWEETEAKSLQSCPTLRNPVDCSQPGSSAHGISQARILEWVATSSSRQSSRPRGWTSNSCVSCTGRQITTSTTWEAQLLSTSGEKNKMALSLQIRQFFLLYILKHYTSHMTSFFSISFLKIQFLIYLKHTSAVHVCAASVTSDFLRPYGL